MLEKYEKKVFEGATLRIGQCGMYNSAVFGYLKNAQCASLLSRTSRMSSDVYSRKVSFFA